MLNLSKLTEMNHWWKLGKVKNEFALPYERKLFREVLKHLNLRQIVGLAGLRRVGKTTMMYQVINHLIKDRENPLNILYFSFDESNVEINEIIKVYEEEVLKNEIADKERYFMFFDEIQKLGDWQNKIKLLYDMHPNIKIFISGSASVNILLPAKESLAGRVFFFDLDLLSFEEFLELRGKDMEKIRKNPNLWERELRIEFNNYMLRPFPEIVSAPEELARKYLKETVIERVILKDLTSLFAVRELEALEKIVSVIASQPGLIINLDDMSKDFGISRQVLSNYLYYLECCLLVRRLSNLRGSFKTASRKLKKYYLSHPCFSLALSSPGKGELAETCVAFKTKSKRYWRDGEKEIDFIVDGKSLLPVEVKYRQNIRRQDLKSLIYFMNRFRIEKALVVTDDKDCEETIEKKKVIYTPLWKFLLE